MRFAFSFLGGLLTLLSLQCLSSANSAPVPTAVTPVNATLIATHPKTFTASYVDADGAGDIAQAAFMVHGSSAVSYAIAAYYDHAANLLYLMNDTGTALIGGYAPGSANTISNGQGNLNCATTSVNTAGNELDINWNITTTNFVGTKNTFALAKDTAGVSSDWVNLGPCRSVANVPPANVSVYPAAATTYSGIAQPLNSSYGSTNGVSDIKSVSLLVGPSADPAAGFCCVYDPASGKFYVRDTDGSLLGGYPAYSNQVITTARGSLNLLGCGATNSNDLTVSWSITPSAPLEGAQNLYLSVTDEVGVVYGPDAKGTWNIVSPTSGSHHTNTSAPTVAGWGDNSVGQLGYGNNATFRTTPFPVNNDGALSGKKVVQVAAGINFSLALCSDGTLAAWGSNQYGQLGNGTQMESDVPVAVNMQGEMTGKQFIAVAANWYTSVALCSDGTVAIWGYTGALLDRSDFLHSTTPHIFASHGAFGQGVTAIAVGRSHRLLLLANGTVASWGSNEKGQLGSTSDGQDSPVLVNTSGVLSGKKVVAIGAGEAHNLVLCSDGTLATWGANDVGQLGNNAAAAIISLPVAVDTSGVLQGKTVTAIAAGSNHNLVLCSDGTLAGWGSDRCGELGDGAVLGESIPDNPRRFVPVLADQSGVLSGKTVTTICGGDYSSLALCSDGTLASWGQNGPGQLGNGTLGPNSSLPVLVDTSGFMPDTKPLGLAIGGRHDLVIYRSGPPVPISVTPATGRRAAGVTWTFSSLYRDPNGAGEIQVARLLINPTANGVGGILVTYNAAQNRLYLDNDGGWGSLGGYDPGTNVVISNSQGSLNCATTTVTKSGTDLVINWSITAKAGFTGDKNLFGSAKNLNNIESAWVHLGDWSIFTNLTPQTVSLAPASGTSNAGAARLFGAVYSDGNGATDLSLVRVLVNTHVTSAGGINAAYDRAADKLYLYAEDGITLLGGFAPGSNNTISNAQGSLNCAGTSVVSNGNNLKINWKITPAAAFTGSKNLYLLARDAAGAQSTWDQRGAWTVNGPPSNVALLPSSGSSTAGNARVLSSSYSDPNGAADIAQVRLLINNSVTAAKGFNALYDRSANLLYLYAEDGLTLLGGFAPGSANTITNAQGTLNCAAIVVTQAATGLKVNWSFTPSAAFTGIKNIYSQIKDTGGLTDGWDAMGSWTIVPAPAHAEKESQGDGSSGPSTHSS